MNHLTGGLLDLDLVYEEFNADAFFTHGRISGDGFVANTTPPMDRPPMYSVD